MFECHAWVWFLTGAVTGFLLFCVGIFIFICFAVNNQKGHDKWPCESFKFYDED